MSNRGKGWWFLGAMAVIIISVAIAYVGNTTKKSGKSGLIPNAGSTGEEKAENYDTTTFGIVKAVDEAEQTVTVYDTEAGIDRAFAYTGATRVVDRYEKERTMPWLSAGELVNAYYYQASYKLAKIEVSKEAWEYSGIDHFQFDMTKQQVTVAQQPYSYGKDLYITGDGEELGIIDINARDELQMKGVGNKVYSITITKGHGYIRLANYAAFLGGTIEVGYGIILPVMEDMLIAAREGAYKVQMEKGELVGTKDVRIERNEEYILDMGEFHADEERTGKATFMIDPEGAKLYINGIETNYSKKVKLNYGDYEIRVEMEGYATFLGTLTIEEQAPVICISLSEDGADTSGTTDGATVTPSSSNGSSNNTNESGNGENNSNNANNANESKEGNSNNENKEDGNSEAKGDGEKEDTSGSSSAENGVGTTLVDEEHVITISAPEGAKVYWNGAYKGTVPVSFAKEIGSHVITFSQTGYLTRSYSCEIVNDSNDVTLNFPDMVKK